MQHQAVKVRLYPTTEQQEILSQHFGCSRWWWNHALNLCIETYKATGKGLTQVALNKFLPHLKKEKETEWLSECYSQVLQATTRNLGLAIKTSLRVGLNTLDSKPRRIGNQSSIPNQSKLWIVASSFPVV